MAEFTLLGRRGVDETDHYNGLAREKLPSGERTSIQGRVVSGLPDR